MTYVTDTVEDDTLLHQKLSFEGQMVQSAWVNYEFQGKVHLVYEWEDRHLVVTQDATGFSLVAYIHEDVAPPSGMSFWPRMDRLETATGIYDATTQTTTFTHTGRDGTLADSRIVLNVEDRYHQVLVPASLDDNGDPVFNGRWDTISDFDEDGEKQYNTDGTEMRTAVTPYLGYTYTAELVLTNLWAGMSPQLVAVASLYVFHLRSTDYDVIVNKPDGTEETRPWEGKVAGTMVLGVPSLSTHFSEHSSIGDVREVDLTLRHTSPGQVIWTGLMYLADVGGIG